MISATFERLRLANQKALVAFVTAGDPSLEQLPEILRSLKDGGADLIEIGIPFSDPIADGPVIQAASQRALDRGVTPRDVLSKIKEASAELGDTPLILMGYYNPLLRWGLNQFAIDAKDAGVAGVIVCDLIPEEASEWVKACKQTGLCTIFLAAPTSTDERLDAVCNASSGFVYSVSRTGVTGSRSDLQTDIADLVNRIKSRTETPVCVGFGIRTPEHVASVCKVADGAVVGSLFVQLLADGNLKLLESEVARLKLGCQN
ncbi:MAG: tryptophan synthase subunit alpha [Fimbriimonadaceae bacterium]